MRRWLQLLLVSSATQFLLSLVIAVLFSLPYFVYAFLSYPLVSSTIILLIVDSEAEYHYCHGSSAETFALAITQLVLIRNCRNRLFLMIVERVRVTSLCHRGLAVRILWQWSCYRFDCDVGAILVEWDASGYVWIVSWRLPIRRLDMIFLLLRSTFTELFSLTFW